MERFVEILIRLESECIKSLGIVEAAKKDLHTLRCYLSMAEFVDDGIVVDEDTDESLENKELINDDDESMKIDELIGAETVTNENFMTIQQHSHPTGVIMSTRPSNKPVGGLISQQDSDIVELHRKDRAAIHNLRQQVVAEMGCFLASTMFKFSERHFTLTLPKTIILVEGVSMYDAEGPEPKPPDICSLFMQTYWSDFVSVLHLFIGVIYCLVSWAVGLPTCASMDANHLKLLIPVAVGHTLSHVTSNALLAGVVIPFTIQSNLWSPSSLHLHPNTYLDNRYPCQSQGRNDTEIKSLAWCYVLLVVCTIF